MGWLNFDGSKFALESLEKIREELKEWDALDFFEKLRQYFDNELDASDTAKINMVIQALGLTDEVQKIGAVFAKIPPAAWQLFKRLSQLHDRIQLPLLDGDRKFKSVDGAWSSLLGFELASEIGVQAFSARQKVAMVPGLVVPSGVAFFQLDGVGSLQVKASGGLAFNSGSLKAGFQAGGQVELGYLYEDEPSTRVIHALLDHGTDLVAPFSLEKIGNAYKKHLRAIHFQAQGNLAISGALSVGQTWGTTIQVKNETLGVDTPVGIDASVSAGITADFKLDGGFDLLIQPQKNRMINVRLNRSKNRSRTLGLNLNAQIGITGLDVIGNAIMKKYIPDGQPLIDKLTPYLDLGSLLRGKISESIGGFLGEPENQALRDALVNALTGTGSSENLTKALLDIIEKEANSQLDTWLSKGTEAGNGILTKVADRLGLTADARQLFLSKFSGKLTEGLQEVEQDLEKDLKELLDGKSKPKLEEILKPLEEFGEKVGNLIADAQNLVDKVLKPSLKLLRRYQSYRNKVQKAVDGSARLKLGLSFSRSFAATKSGGVMLEFQIDPSVDQGREFFRQMLLGSFKEIMAAVQKARASGDVVNGIKLLGGTFSARFGKKVKTDFSVNLAGLNDGISGESTTIRNLDLQATWDLSGNVLTASGEASLKKVNRFMGETRSASFVNILELAGGKKSLANKIFSSSVSLTFTDKKTKIGEIRRLLGSLEKSDLIPVGTTDNAVARYNEMDHQKLGAAIGLSLPLDGSDLITFLNQSSDDILLTGFRNNLTIFEPKARERNRILNDLDNRLEGGDRLAKIKFLLKRESELGSPDQLLTSNSNAKRLIRNARKLWLYSRNAQVLVNMQQIMNKVAELSLTGSQGKENLKKIEKLMDKFNEEVARVLKVGSWFNIAFVDKVPKATLAFIATLRELTQGTEEPTPLLPVIRWAEDGEEVDEILM